MTPILATSAASSEWDPKTTAKIDIAMMLLTALMLTPFSEPMVQIQNLTQNASPAHPGDDKPFQKKDFGSIRLRRRPEIFLRSLLIPTAIANGRDQLSIKQLG
jgi:hypothetical protein